MERKWSVAWRGPLLRRTQYLLRRRKTFVHIAPAMHPRRPEPLCEMRQRTEIFSRRCDLKAACLFGVLIVLLAMVVAGRHDGSPDFRMLTQLTRVLKVKAARILVALYAFCLVVPVGFAFADSALARYLPTPTQVQHAGHVHGEAAHVHQGMTHANHDHQVSANAESADAINDHAGMTHSGGKSTAPGCCGVMCISALPASMFDLTPRAMTDASVVAPSDAGIAGEAPDLLYRPPIVLLSM
jgi:hypothetical protein